MSKKVAWSITDNNITVNYDNETHIVSRSEKLADKLIEALRKNDLKSIPDLVSAAKKIEKYSDGNFLVKNGEILVDGKRVPGPLGKKIMNFSDEGLPYQPLINFAKKLQNNPSFRSVNELFLFLEKNDHPITEDGNFIAYKKVRDNFLDVHSGTFDNSVGNVLEVPRNQVDDNPEVTCSYGLHVANFEYATHFYSGGKMLEVEVDPADVVSVPVDYDNSKMRVCKYKVLGVVTQPHNDALHLRYVNKVSSDCEGCDSCDLSEDSEECSLCDMCGDQTDLGFDLCEACADEKDSYPYDDELDE